MTDPLLRIEHLDIAYGRGPTTTHAVRDVSLDLTRGHTLGLVGESGSGKTTLAKAIVGGLRPRSGSITIDGTDVTSARGRDRTALRRRVQLIPQDPYSSLDPRRTIGQALAEAIDPRRASVRRHRATITEWLERVRMPADAVDRYPHEFSGGQRQRIAIARGLLIQPSLVVADEITSALDVSVQAEILALLDELRHELRLTLVFISHNLAVVRQVSDEVAVLYHGELVEHGRAAHVYDSPTADYTRALLDADPASPGFSLS
ncbi:ABC transporter ATP-binding protein [Streptomyces millisiae]|uniref:Dipeptide/oligopeptide/nickel ABC transporter ATP-binding protein n=1 Tax=Streptomyces millisiae TaxID=3075542 RepID=A0ABU2LHF0_9ACTN|nr:dipeptide/oligopeptide/nickel ABC transporter ATP-binding protein [Streptomyces sp. DSM 44918]MDT0317019.1 dipeptide/oligopeptide/nickel ABC transporter ATP-binding protein [Streptomyces sp. DSM 44918]